MRGLMKNVKAKTERSSLKEIKDHDTIVIPDHNFDIWAVDNNVDNLNFPRWKWQALGFISYAAYKGWLEFNRISNQNYTGDYNLNCEATNISNSY